MADTVVSYRFLLRGGTAADLATVNEVPRARELIVEVDTRKLKLGDGITRYNLLPYVTTGGGGGGGTAADVEYNNAVSGLAAEDVQAAIDELNGKIDGGGSGADPHGALVRSLLNMDSGEGSTVFVDQVAGMVWTASGSAVQRAAAARFGDSGLRISGSAGALLLNGGSPVPVGHPAYIANGDDFTVEAFIRPAVGGTGFRDFFVMKSTYDGLLIEGSGTTHNFIWYDGGTKLSFPANLGAWQHVAAVRKAGQIRLYVNGSAAPGSYANTAAFDWFRMGQNNGGSEQFYGDIDEFRLTRYARYDGSFTPPSAPFPIPGTDPGIQRGPQGPSGAAFLESTYHLLHMDGAGGSTDFIDLGGHVFTRTGTPVISSAQSKFGGASARFSGGTDSIKDISSPALQLGLEDFTLEMFYREAARTPGSTAVLFDQRRDDSSNGLVLDITAAGVIAVFSSSAYIITGPALALDTWYHIALVRFAGIFTLYVNGVAVGSYATPLQLLPAPVTIGGRWNAASGRSVNGYVDEYRLSKGLARYTANFVPPTAAFVIPVGPALPAFTVATLPSAVVNRYVQVFVTDLAGGAEPCISDGSTWRRLSDRTAAS